MAKKIAAVINGAFLMAGLICLAIVPFHAHTGKMSDDPYWICSQFCLVVCLGFLLYRKLTK
jgi:hypothetical protein